jgi:diguanylate cyclase (GGDEF)-like protein
MSQLKHLLRKRPDPYAGADLATAKRLGGALWVLSVAITLILTPLAPTTAVLESGWLIWGLVLSAAVFGAHRLIRRGERVHYNELLVVGYAAALAIAVLDWLAGGKEAPYHHLLLPLTIFVTATHPPRRAAAFLPVVWGVASAGLLYEGWDGVAAANTLAEVLVITTLGLLAMLLMDTVRAQRVGLREEGDDAKREARLDPGTGLRNRRALEEELETQVARARAAVTPLSVVVLDLDDFKAVNDAWGHIAGDECLRAVGDGLRGAVREPDACFRWAGDEFALVLPGVDIHAAGSVGERVAWAVSRTCLRPDGERMRLTFGVAELGDEANGAELLDAADRALLSRKASRTPIARERKPRPAERPARPVGPSPARFRH